MPSAQPSSSTDHVVKVSGVSNFNMSMIVGLLIIIITVLIIMSIIMKVWMKNRRPKVVPYILEKKSSPVPSKFGKLMSMQLLTPPTRPKLVFDKDTTLPVYRKSDTWDEYLKMIQSPDKLNDVVRTMKIDNSSSTNISSNFQENGNTNDNGKISYDNSNNSCNHTLQRESLHLQQKMYNHSDYHFS